MSSSKSTANLFIRNQQWTFFENNFLPSYYEQDIICQQQEQTSFRSVSPKMYCQEKKDYFDNDEWELSADDSDALYEATLLNSNFLSSLEKEEKKPSAQSSALDRLCQILDHINPNHSSTHDTMNTHFFKEEEEEKPFPSIRSQFSSVTSTSKSSISYRQPNFIAFSIPDPQGKGKSPKSTL